MGSSQNSLVIILGMLVGQAPMLLVYLVGLVLAAVWRRRYPRAAMLVIIGLSLHVFTVIAWAATYSYVMHVYFPSAGASGISTALLVMSLASATLHAVATGFLIAAAFVGRRRDSFDPAFPVAMRAPMMPPPLQT